MLDHSKLSHIEYKLQTDEGEIVACDSCMMEVPTASFRAYNNPRMLCEFCSTTIASRYTENPAMDDHQALRAEIWQAAACVYNMLQKGKHK